MKKRRHMTQIQRVEQLLRRRGDQGITARDFAPPSTADGGPPIFRLAARIADLRAGHELPIVTEGVRDGFAIYVLRETRRLSVEPPEATDDQESLLPDQPRSAVLGWEAA